MEKLSRKKHIDIYRHLAFSAVGGYFAAYAVLCRMGVMANAQTVNLLELVLKALAGDGVHVLYHLGSLACYILGTVLTVVLPYRFGWNARYLSPLVSALMAVLLAFLPADMPVLVALYPIFFAMSFQYSSFSGADGFNSATVFSSNNTKQTFLALAEYCCRRDTSQLRRARLFGFTLLCFYGGAAMAFFAVKWTGIAASLLVLPLLAWATVLVVCEDRAIARRAAEAAE